jgi:hypothetical protein
MPEPQYDVFMSHNSEDKLQVERIASRLAKKARLRPWLDTWNLIPGEPWQPAIEEALLACRACAVFVGRTEIGPWQLEEMRAAINRRVNATNGAFRVIPVLLPPAQRVSIDKLPSFLASSSWVEFHETVDDKEALRRLVCGIQGTEPGPTRRSRFKEKQIQWVIVVDGTFDDTTKARAEVIAERLRCLLKDGNLTIRKIDRGSVVIFLESSRRAFQRMKALFEMRDREVQNLDILDVQTAETWAARRNLGGERLSSNYQPETPFDSIEGSHEYVALLAEAVDEARREVDAEIAIAVAEDAGRRREALQLVAYNLAKLDLHMKTSRRILNDLRSLRRLLLAERTALKKWRHLENLG